MVSTSGAPDRWDVANVLAEPTRRAMFAAVRQAHRPLTRDEVAETVGVNRRLTTFHLERLADAGLLATDYARPAERAGGPGAGRPAKRYAASGTELELSVPPRHYDMAARLLAQAIVRDPADAAGAALEVARAAGRRAGELRRPARPATPKRGRTAALAALADLGYEPVADGGGVRLRNCPFRAVAETAPELVCGMNRELVAGIFDGLGIDAGVALAPCPPDCCVKVTVPG
jgi:predicted ArsR family transcriptional regulator